MRSIRKTKKKLRSSRKRKSLGSRKVGGVLCGNPFTITSFIWNRNSCYFDTLLLSLLHPVYPKKSLRKALMDVVKPAEPFDDTAPEYSKRWIALHLVYLFDILHGKIADHSIGTRKDVLQKSTEYRDTLRSELQKIIFKELDTMKGAIGNKKAAREQRTLTTYQDPMDLLDWIVKYLDLTPFLTYVDQTGDVQNENYHIVSLNEFSLFEPIETSHPFGKQLLSVQYACIPIQIPRFATGEFDATELEIPEQVTFAGETYALQSILMYFESIKHYVCYVRCTDEIDKWLYYDGLNKSNTKQDTILDIDFSTLITQNVPGRKENPKEIATNLFYVKV